MILLSPLLSTSLQMKTRHQWFIGILVVIFFSALLVFCFSGTPRGHLNFGRSWHTALLLRDGRVLVMGGMSSSGPSPLATFLYQLLQKYSWLTSLLHLSEGGSAAPTPVCEIFDPKTCIWTKTAHLNGSHLFGNAYLLPDGSVLYGAGEAEDINGSEPKKPCDPAERLDLARGKWVWCPLPKDQDSGKSLLASLPGNQILKLQDQGGLDGCEAWVFNNSTDQWLRHPEYDCKEGFTDIPRVFSLPSGEVVIEDVDTGLFDPKTAHWMRITQMDLIYYTVAECDGTLIRAGGMGDDGPYKNAYRLDLSTKTWVGLPDMKVPRIAGTLTELRSGKVLMAGGGVASCELFDPKTNTWSFTGSLHEARTHHTATLLPDGRVLVVGGMAGDYPGINSVSDSLSTCEIYDPEAGVWTQL